MKDYLIFLLKLILWLSVIVFIPFFIWFCMLAWWQINIWLDNDPVKYADLEPNPYVCCSEDYLEHLPEPPIIEIPFNAHKADEEISIDFQIPARRTAYRFVLKFHASSPEENKYIIDLQHENRYRKTPAGGYYEWIPVSQEFSLIKLEEDKTNYTNADRLVHLYDQKQTDYQLSQTIYKGKFTPGYYRLSLKNLTAHPHLKDIKTSIYIRYYGGHK